jgi:CO/xanthine dehydrogenase Mo-binding subunit
MKKERKEAYKCNINSRHAYNYVGQNTTLRKDGLAIVQGKATFLDDFKLSDMLIGKVKGSPHPHALIKSIDVSKAKAIPGVHSVLTWEDVNQDWRFGWPPQKPVLGPHIHYCGDAVALVAAETDVIAKAAIDQIEVEYEILKPVFNVLDAQKDDAPQLYPDMFEHNIVPGGYAVFQPNGPWWHLEKGDVEKGFAECAYVAEDTVSFDKKPIPLAPEPHGVIVRWDGGNDYTVWATSQSLEVLQIVNGTVIPAHIEASSFNVGGSYGNKTTMTAQTNFGILLAKATNRPVKLMATKVEQNTMLETRLGTAVQARIGMDKDGVVRAVKGFWSIDNGAFCNSTQGQVSVGLGESQLMMSKCPNWDLDTGLTVTNKMIAGIVRGYGGQELNSCLSILMTRTMREGDLDPIECFKRNFVHPGDRFFWRDGREWTARSVNYDHVIDKAAAQFRWHERWQGWGKPTWVSEDGKKVRGIGCSVTGNADVGENFAEAYVRMVPDLHNSDFAWIHVHCNVVEIGNGQRSSVCKMVAEILNVPLEHVVIVPADTLLSPKTEGLGGSRGTITNGRAVCNAALDLRQKMFEAAQLLTRQSADCMECVNFGIMPKAKPELWIPFEKTVPDHHTSLTGFGRHCEDFGTPNFFMTYIEVEVDKETGMAKATDILGATDCGQIIDPGSAEMQCHGGIGSASLDTAFFEENIVDPITGKPLTFDLVNYKWRTFNEFPHFDTCIEESKWDTHFFQAVGFGEIAGAAAASAAMMAISNAIGVEVKDYPATPDVILTALGKIQRRD